MKDLFVYGTLMFDEVWQRLIRNKYKRTPAILPHFQRLAIKNETYPAIIRAMNSNTHGILVHHVSCSDIKLLDRFEGKYYRRIPVIVNATNKKYPADVYVINNRFRKILTDREWLPEKFSKQHIDRFLSRYKNFHS